MDPQSKLSTRQQLMARADVFNRVAQTPVPAYAEDLAGLWAALQKGEGLAPDTAVVARIRTLLTANQEKLATRGHSVFMERLAHSIPEPSVALSGRGYTWNEPFAHIFSGSKDMHREVGKTLAPLVRIIDGDVRVEAAALLYPLSTRVFSLRLVKLQEEELALAYFFATRLTLPELPFRTSFCLCARLSGLAAKQIAPLLNATKDQVDTISKNHRTEFQSLKQQLAGAPSPMLIQQD